MSTELPWSMSTFFAKFSSSMVMTMGSSYSWSMTWKSASVVGVNNVVDGLDVTKVFLPS